MLAIRLSKWKCHNFFVLNITYFLKNIGWVLTFPKSKFFYHTTKIVQKIIKNFKIGENKLQNWILCGLSFQMSQSLPKTDRLGVFTSWFKWDFRLGHTFGEWPCSVFYKLKKTILEKLHPIRFTHIGPKGILNHFLGPENKS